MMSGGCLCGHVRYETDASPAWTAICYCRDCQRASGSGYMPVMGVRRDAMRITGQTSSYEKPALRGPSTRHFCPTCGSLIFGGVEGPPDQTMSVYVGTLDDPSGWRPQIAIFTKNRNPWDCPVAGATEYPGMPG